MYISVQKRLCTGSTLNQTTVKQDLAEITELAQKRKCWRGLTSQIDKAAEVSQTNNWDATRQ